MEAAAIPSGEATGEATEQVAESQETTPQPDPRLDTFESRLTEATDGIRALMQRIPEDGFGPQAEPEPEPDYEAQLAEILDQAQVTGSIDPGALNEVVQSQVQSHIDQIRQELGGQVAQIQNELAAGKLDQLERRHNLNDQQKEQLVERVADLAVSFGDPELAQQLAYNPQFVETVLLAERARANAAQETPGGAGPEAHLETGGGAAPAEPEGDPWEAIVRSGAPSGPLF